MFLTLMTMTALTGLWWLYAIIVTPRIAPPILANTRRAIVDPDEIPIEVTDSSIEDARRYLPDAPWAEQAKVQLRLARAAIYSNTSQPIDESERTYEFRPFAMILFDQSQVEDDNNSTAAPKRPVTLIAESGLVQFAEKFNPVTQKPGRVVGGKLEGAVTVAGSDGLTFQGHNVFFNEEAMQVLTDEPVEFTYQNHRGNADHGLRVDLIRAEGPPKPDQLLSIGGFRRVLLRGHVEMNLAADRPDVASNGPLHVVCDEGFDFNLQSLIASFKINVNVTRPTGPDEAFLLKKCQYLDLILEDGSSDAGHGSPHAHDAPTTPIVRSNAHEPSEVRAEQSLNDSGNQLPRKKSASRHSTQIANSSALTLKELRASSTNRMELESQHDDITAFMTNLRYDVATQTAVLKDAEAVFIRQQKTGTELRCPELTFVQGNDGEIVSATGRGKGWIRRGSPDSEQPEFWAQWNSYFRLLQQPGTNMDWLELNGRAIAKQPAKKSGLSAEVIRLCFDRVTSHNVDRESVRDPARDPVRGRSRETAERTRANSAAEGAATMSVNKAAARSVPDNSDDFGSNSSARSSSQFRPRQLQAFNNVVVVSPQGKAESKQLQLFFEEAAPQAANFANDENRPNSQRRVQPVSRRAGGGSGEHGNVGTSVVSPLNRGADAAPLANVAKESEPFQLMADSIRAKVRLPDDSANRDSRHRDPGSRVPDSRNRDDRDFGSASPASDLIEVITEGSVDLQQSHGDDQDPLHVTGQRVHLENKDGHGQVVHVIGQPAVVRDRGFDIEGNDIFLDQNNNKTWINGSGVLRLPVKNDFNGKSLQSPSLLTVWWKEKMVFDGQSANFYDDVKAALNDSRLQCEEMEVVLTQRILFAGTQSKMPAAEVRQVICKEGVEIDHSQYVEKELTEIQRDHVAQLTLDLKTGVTEAVGPGNITFWRPGRGKRAALAPRAVAQANRPLESEVANWEYTCVNFSGAMKGNLNERKTTFNDRVRIVYGPVARPLDVIDPDVHLPKDGGEMECNALTIEQLQETGSEKKYIGLTAEGNAKLEGRSFYAQADAISFDESKELYTLRSKGSRQVTIWRQAVPGGEYSEASAKSMQFIPSQNLLKSDKTTGIRGAN
jgi:hypothetical protein